MSKERRKQQKKKARQERVRQDKHIRQSQPSTAPVDDWDVEADDVDGDFDPASMPELPSRLIT